MKTKRVEEAYYAWLISQIDVPNNGKTFHELFSRMHETEFHWTVPNDDNRIHDARDLRIEFSHASGGLEVLHIIPSTEGVSFLEVLIGLSRRTAFADGEMPQEWWAWKLIKNIRLNRMSDPLLLRQRDRTDSILETVIWRTYREDGLGGFFPLKHPKEDQTKVEIWYQMNAYLIETQHL